MSEPWFELSYTCPACGTNWDDEWDSVVDATCPYCGLRHVTAARNKQVDGADEPTVVEHTGEKE